MSSPPTSDESATGTRNFRIPVSNSSARHPDTLLTPISQSMSPPSSSTVLHPVQNYYSSQESNSGFDPEYFNTFPPGYRFTPTNQELVLHYLMPKVHNQPLPRHRIAEVNLYEQHPEVVADMFKELGEGEWYFFTPRNRKYPNGLRPDRAAGGGFWKATGADKEVVFKGEVVGCKKCLVFHLGRAPKGIKTNWMMHEFKLSDPPERTRNGLADMKLDDWVLCKIYVKSASRNARNRRNLGIQDRDEDPPGSDLTMNHQDGSAGTPGSDVTMNHQDVSTGTGHQDPPVSDLTMNHHDGSTGMGNAGIDISHSGQFGDEIGDQVIDQVRGYDSGSSFQVEDLVENIWSDSQSHSLLQYPSFDPPFQNHQVYYPNLQSVVLPQFGHSPSSFYQTQFQWSNANNAAGGTSSISSLLSQTLRNNNAGAAGGTASTDIFKRQYP